MPKTLIVLHGWGHSKAMWADFVARMSNDCAVAAWDLPGFGEEPMPPSAWGVPEYAAWVTRKIEERGLRDVVLLGHSFGGRISSYIASQRPGWLRAVVLYAAPSLYRPLKSAQLRIALAKAFRMLPIPPTLRHYLRSRDAKAADMSGHSAIFRKVVAFDQTALLPRINVPTFLVWGEHDDEVPVAVAQEMAALIPLSEIEVLQNAGHSAHLEHPVLFYGVIKKFVESLA